MINFTPWDQLLRQYVDSQGCVDYRTWKAEQPQALAEWLAQQSRLELAADADADEQLALWLNLYNAIAINQVLEHYPITSIRPKILGVPNWIAFLWFFLRPVFSLGGKRYSLYQIENTILRRNFNEPRIHFALVCASIGCPLLRNSAYLPHQVRTQLAEETTRFINNPKKVHYDAASGTLYCSKIFKWYRQDFLKVATSIPDYIHSYLQTDAPITSQSPIRYLDYSWNLNEKAATEDEKSKSYVSKTNFP